MTTNITTMTNLVIGVGHVMEDKNPIPTEFRNPKVKPDDAEVSDNETEDNDNINGG